MAQRRELQFADWDAVLADLRLLSAGCTPCGKWNLGQTVRHLNDWLRFPVEGFPKAPLPMRLMMAVMRNTVGPGMLRKIISTGKMGDGVPTAPQTVYDSTDDSAATEDAIRQLEEAIDLFRRHDGPICSSPVFGKMDKATAEKLQLVHFAHHLSWLSPTN